MSLLLPEDQEHRHFSPTGRKLSGRVVGSPQQVVDAVEYIVILDRKLIPVPALRPEIEQFSKVQWSGKLQVVRRVQHRHHHETDQQYLLLRGNCSLAVAEPKDGILDVQVVRMEVGKVYNIRRETWFNTICEPGARMLYIQDANTTMENSELQELTPEEKVVLTEKYYC